MIQQVRKRNSEIAPFDSEKIYNAVFKAFCAVGYNAGEKGNADRDAAYVTHETLRALSNDLMSVEEIQDIVENTLIRLDYIEVAKAYILYREHRREVRQAYDTLLNYKDVVKNYMDQSDWRVNENATVNYSLGGLILHNSGTISANFWLSEVYDQAIREAHEKAYIHIHDLSMLSPYCAGWSLKTLINEGLGGVSNKTGSKPAKHLLTLCNQMVNYIGILQNEWAGAQAFSSFDTLLAPYVKAEQLEYKAVKQAIQAFVFGINIPCRWGCQQPFSNISLDWTVPQDMKDQPAFVGAEPQPFTYGECQAEMDVINKAFMEVILEGDG